MARQETRSLIDWCHYGQSLARGLTEEQLSENERRKRVVHITGVIHGKFFHLESALLTDEHLYRLVDPKRSVEKYLQVERAMTRQARPESPSDTDMSMKIAALRLSVASLILERLTMKPMIGMSAEAENILHAPVTVTWATDDPSTQSDADVL